MKFPNIIGRREVMQAILLGSATGVVGVLLFILLLNSMDSQFTPPEDNDELIPVTSQQTEEKPITNDGTSEQFYANQHGVFSSFESATEFVYGYASLNTSAVVDIDGTFYVWSSISPTKEEIVKSEDPPSFTKPFQLSAASCEEPELKILPSILKSNDPAKFYFDDGEVPENLPADWQTLTFALSSISKDLSVVRMHLLAHYFTENDCLKIHF